MSELPKGWTQTTVKELAGTTGIFVDGDWVESKDQDPNGDIRLLQLADIGDGTFLNKSDRWINADAFARLRCTELATGDVLIARMPDPLGRACLMPALEQRCVTVVDVAALRVDPKMSDNRWVMHTINAPQLRAEIGAQASGTTRKRISRGNLGNMSVSLPPKAEQKRIADKLDTVLTRVDAVNTSLARVAPLLKRFRQSVLAAATSGRLTEDWRMYSSQAEWRSVKISEICNSVADGDHQAPPQATAGIPFITIAAINDGYLNLGKASRFVPDSYYRDLADKRRPQRGDVLYSVTGSVGIPALVDTDAEFTFQRHIAILRPDQSQISSAFLLHLLGSGQVRSQALEVATGTAQLTIPLSGLRAIHIKLPPKQEQTEIVRRVETLFAFADRLEARLAQAQTAATRLTPALLAKAFRGELVPQDPNDEPAAELVRRLAKTPAIPAKRGRVAKVI
jgi:type I restriction enzyme, S subunit